MPTTTPATRPSGATRARNQFRRWLLWKLTQLGADLPPNPSYAQIREAVERYLMAGKP